MNKTSQSKTSLRSLSEIEERKEYILSEIRNNSTQINKKWHSLFQEPSEKKRGFNVSTLMNTGAGLVDGFLLAWKLYHKFKK